MLGLTSEKLHQVYEAIIFTLTYLQPASLALICQLQELVYVNF